MPEEGLEEATQPGQKRVSGPPAVIARLRYTQSNNERVAIGADRQQLADGRYW